MDPLCENTNIEKKAFLIYSDRSTFLLGTWHLKCAYSPGTTVWFIIVFWIFGGPHVSTTKSEIENYFQLFYLFDLFFRPQWLFFFICFIIALCNKSIVFWIFEGPHVSTDWCTNYEVDYLESELKILKIYFETHFPRSSRSAAEQEGWRREEGRAGRPELTFF